MCRHVVACQIENVLQMLDKKVMLSVLLACQMITDVGNPWGRWNPFRNTRSSRGKF